jgi:hypothetical protein
MNDDISYPPPLHITMMILGNEDDYTVFVHGIKDKLIYTDISPQELIPVVMDTVIVPEMIQNSIQENVDRFAYSQEDDINDYVQSFKQEFPEINELYDQVESQLLCIIPFNKIYFDVRHINSVITKNYTDMAFAYKPSWLKTIWSLFIFCLMYILNRSLFIITKKDQKYLQKNVFQKTDIITSIHDDCDRARLIMIRKILYNNIYVSSFEEAKVKDAYDIYIDMLTEELMKTNYISSWMPVHINALMHYNQFSMGRKELIYMEHWLTDIYLKGYYYWLCIQSRFKKLSIEQVITKLRKKYYPFKIKHELLEPVYIGRYLDMYLDQSDLTMTDYKNMIYIFKDAYLRWLSSVYYAFYQHINDFTDLIRMLYGLQNLNHGHETLLIDLEDFFEHQAITLRRHIQLVKTSQK